jgi:hypothetical protein
MVENIIYAAVLGLDTMERQGEQSQPPVPVHGPKCHSPGGDGWLAVSTSLNPLHLSFCLTNY